MSVSVCCPCGAHFEVAESLAGQDVRCPECQASLKVSAPSGGRPRTSGYALASVVLALVGMFTVIFTLLAVVLGIVGLVSIARNRKQLRGVGFAVFGIVVGLIFTGLTLFALSKEELFDRVREQLGAAEADYSGPLEVLRLEEGYAITRPSSKWGISREQLEELDASLILVNVGKDAYVQVAVNAAEWGKSLEQARDDVVAGLRASSKFLLINGKEVPARTTGFTVHDSRRLPPFHDLEALEVLVDLRLGGRPYSYILRLCRRRQADPLYVLTGWVHQRRFAEVEPEIRKALDSFRLLK
jgi:hypothetical protein